MGKYSIQYNEVSYGYIMFESDSLEHANELMNKYKRDDVEAIEYIERGNKAERDYEFTLTGNVQEVK